ncbi:MAG TPA: phosphohexose mutase [Nitrospira sp.]|nr:phosphohexose mutase [Nitrospira sp.]HBR50031.1 phosphohexose mutase [Nitrospira sp.]
MPSAVILAGGLGTRLRSAVPDLPKPMAPINGRPFLEHQLEYWINQGVSRFVLSVGYRHEAITGHFGAHYKGVEIEYAIEDQPLGTGGGLLLAVEKLDQDKPFLLLNGDTYFEADWNALDVFAVEHEADWCFSLFETSERGRYMGIEMSAQGRITLLKSGVEQGPRLANGGVYWVHPRALSGTWRLGEKLSLEDDLFPHALTAGRRLCGIEFGGTFIDIGVPDDYHRASSLLVG